MTESATQRAIDAVWRIESARLIASLTRVVRDVGLAEDLAQDALVAALEQWPESGVPDNPGAWLMTAARRRAIDAMRHDKLANRKQDDVGREITALRESSTPDIDAAIDDDVGDDLLRLMFITCHPVLAQEARVALTLRLLGGLTTDEIARAYLVSEPAVAQRIVRAKRALRNAAVEFELPRGEARAERLASVLEVIYLIFNEGYAATAGDDWMRPALCDDALRLGRILAGLMPVDPEVHGLVALMEIQASRTHTRVNADGKPVLLLDQDRSRWDRVLIGRGLRALARAERFTGQLTGQLTGQASEKALGQSGGAPGQYTLQAAIAACHARALTADATDWNRIAELYAVLVGVVPSPIIELNRAVAVSMARGPAAGLDIADALMLEPALANYHLLPAVRGHLLQQLGRFDEAGAEFARAASLTRNVRERNLLSDRAAAMAAR